MHPTRRVVAAAKWIDDGWQATDRAAQCDEDADTVDRSQLGQKISTVLGAGAIGLVPRAKIRPAVSLRFSLLASIGSGCGCGYIRAFSPG